MDRNANAELAAPARKADARCDAAGLPHRADQAGGILIVPEFSPGLRNVAMRAPYMYGDQIGSLEDVVRRYATAPQASDGNSELKPVSLSECEIPDLVALLGTLAAPK